jgi:hypothetical protein
MNTQIYEGTNQIQRRPSATTGPTSTVVHADPWEAVVGTVVRTMWAAVGPAGRGGTPWTIGPGQAGRRRTRREAWDGFHSPHNPEVG